MGRGKVVMERIENKINRQVTFSKRRNGLLKKAYELSLLCDAEVALILFSAHGKLFEFGSNNNNVGKTLERYRQICYSSEASNVVENQNETMYAEILRLRAAHESLERSQRHFLGEDLGPLCVKELQKIEKQLDRTLLRARQRKTELMLKRLEELQKKAQDLREENIQLQSKLEEEGQSPNSNILVTNNSLRVHPSQSIHNIQPGYHQFIDRHRMNEGRTLVAGGTDPTQGGAGMV